MTAEERPECPVCSASESREAFSKDGFRHFDCPRCRALYLFPAPTEEELTAFYVAQAEETCSSMCWERGAQHLRHYEKIWDAALQKIEEYSGRGPLLDVGCGGGQFLAFARERGWSQLEGIEPSPPAAALAEERSGATVHSDGFLDLRLEAGRFSAVTMWNVLEHAAAPRAFAEEVHRLLAPSGLFVADCPNRHGVTMRLLGKGAFIVAPPEHVTYFCHRSLRALLEPVGFDIRGLETNTIYLQDWLRFLRRAGDEVEARAAHQTWYSRLTGSDLALRGIDLANVFLNVARLGDQMFVMAQKARR